MNETHSNRLQEGIFYNRKSFKANQLPTRIKSNDSFAIIFLKIIKTDKIYKINQVLINLWQIYKKLKNGTIDSLPNFPFPSGDPDN